MTARHILKHAVTIAAAGAIACVDLAPAIAAPVPTSTAIVKAAAPDMLDQVRVRRGRRGAVGAGIAFGMIGAMAGIAAANRYNYGYGYGYYGPDYYGDPGYYGSPYYGRGYYGGYAYDPGPAIALGVIGAAAGAIAGAPGIRRGRCWVVTDSERNFGYWGRCYR